MTPLPFKFLYLLLKVSWKYSCSDLLKTQVLYTYPCLGKETQLSQMKTTQDENKTTQKYVKITSQLLVHLKRKSNF